MARIMSIIDTHLSHYVHDRHKLRFTLALLACLHSFTYCRPIVQDVFILKSVDNVWAGDGHLSLL